MIALDSWQNIVLFFLPVLFLNSTVTDSGETEVTVRITLSGFATVKKEISARIAAMMRLKIPENTGDIEFCILCTPFLFDSETAPFPFSS